MAEFLGESLTALVARRVACPEWPDCEDDEGPCLACTQAGAIIAVLEDCERLRAAAPEAKEGLWALLHDPLVPHRLTTPPGMPDSRDRRRWERAVAAHDALRAALKGRDG